MNNPTRLWSVLLQQLLGVDDLDLMYHQQSYCHLIVQSEMIAHVSFCGKRYLVTESR